VLTLARLAQQKGLEGLLDVARGPWPDRRSGAAQVSADALGDTEGDAGGGAGGGGGLVPLFVVAGEGPLLDELRGRVDAERLPVIFLGGRDDVPDLLAAATAVVWASRWEGQPLSLSEALMAGRPVIATAVGGIPELLGGAVMLVPYGDTAAMRNAVREVIGDEAVAGRMAAAAARRGAQLPDADDAVASVAGVYGASRSCE
jgi:glycosyltransferase involved in cell wall biosynthesis